MRKTRELLMKLSLNAEKNWHQNKGAKRRVIKRDEDIAALSLPGLQVECQPLETTIWTKEQSCRAPDRSLQPGRPQEKRHKNEAGGRWPPATQRYFPALPPQRALRCRLHHDGRHAQANGYSRRDSEERYPHGPIPFVLIVCKRPLALVRAITR